MDVQKQISYLRESAIEDLAVANELLAKERIRYALFFAHLCVEKMLRPLCVSIRGI
jgi:HEPN domain-containing protein